MRTCLMTGGAGFIGCAISAELVERFDRVVAFDNLHPQIHRMPVRPSGLHRAVDLIRGDVTSADHWRALLRAVRPDVVIHLAAETGTGQSLTEASRHADVNLLGTTRMMDALASSGHLPDRIVLASSRAVYGEGEWRDPAGTLHYPGQRTRAQLERAEWDFGGSHPVPAEAARTHPHPTSVYGSTKLGQENVLRAWAQSFGVALGIVRLQNVYGPGQSLINSYTGIVTLFAQWARDGRSIPVYEDGLITRDFVFITDVVEALVRLALPHTPVAAVPFDIGSGAGTTVLGLARHLAQRYGAPEPHVTGQFRNGDVRHAACSIGRSEAELGWSPRVPLASGLDRLAAWIEGERVRRVA